jgi:biotin synthase
VNERIAESGRRVLSGESLGREDLLALASLAAASRDGFCDLLYWANRIRTANFGRTVRLCSIIPGKLGNCSEDCKWCAQSSPSAPGVTASKRTSIQEITAAAATAAERHSDCFCVVNSGRRPSSADVAAVVEAAAAVRASLAPVPLSASLGELTDDQAAALAAAGIKRYCHNLETSRRYYPQVVTTHTYDDRLRTLAAVRRAGIQICCGGLFGLGETWEDRVDLALTLRDEVCPNVSPLNFLSAAPGSALAAAPTLQPAEILTVIAIFRFALPAVDLKIAGGREANLRDLQSWMFYAGATSTLIGNYLTMRGRSAEDDIQMIRDLGLEIVTD